MRYIKYLIKYPKINTIQIHQVFKWFSGLETLFREHNVLPKFSKCFSKKNMLCIIFVPKLYSGTEKFVYSKGFPNILHQKLCNLLNDFCIDLYKLHNFWCEMFGKPFEYAKFSVPEYHFGTNIINYIFFLEKHLENFGRKLCSFPEQGFQTRKSFENLVYLNGINFWIFY